MSGFQIWTKMSKGSFHSYIVRVILTRFFGARIVEMENEMGDIEPHVCIPMLRNNLKEGFKGSVSAYFFMTKSTIPDEYGWTHYLKPKVSTEHLRKMDELGYKTPYIGNAKEQNYIMFKNEYKQAFVKAKYYE